VIAVDAQRRDLARFPPADVSAEAFEHHLHHVTLAMVRRRSMGENNKLHSNAGLRSVSRINYEIVTGKSRSVNRK
jgi:hypothetical protein